MPKFDEAPAGGRPVIATVVRSVPWTALRPKQTLLTVRCASAMEDKFAGGKGSSRENHSYRSVRAGGGTEVSSAPHRWRISGSSGAFFIAQIQEIANTLFERPRLEQNMT
ncbi:MAG: hypothetical protein ACRED2_05250, partial [Methylocella sp.]